jgi:two-component system response regulator (stage 0 sporulation protein F)
MNHKLLIVEDEDSLAFALQQFFAARGFEVHCAGELEEAAALLSQVHYSAMITDLRLTGACGAQGLELITHVRNHSPWTRTILMTALGSTGLDAEALSRGADAVVRKPGQLAELARVVAALVG